MCVYNNVMPDICTYFRVYIILNTAPRLFPMCRTALIRSGIESPDIGVSNGGWNVEFRPLRANLVIFEICAKLGTFQRSTNHRRVRGAHFVNILRVGMWTFDSSALNSRESFNSHSQANVWWSYSKCERRDAEIKYSQWFVRVRWELRAELFVLIRRRRLDHLCILPHQIFLALLKNEKLARLEGKLFKAIDAHWIQNLKKQ